MSVILSIVFINLIGVISAGPGFLIVLKNALKYGKLGGFYTGLGIAFGDLTHMIYCFLGIGVLISNSLFLFNILKVIGSFYLIYIGFKAFLSKSKTKINLENEEYLKSNFIANFKSGYLLTITNSKATLMFLLIFSTILTPEISIYKSIIAIFMMFINPIIWFGIVSYIFNIDKIRNSFLNYEIIINKTFGIFLIFFGILIILN